MRKMRASLIAVVFFCICGCGSQQSDINANSKLVAYDESNVVWKGRADENPRYKALYERIEECAGAYREYPTITVIDQETIYCTTTDGLQEAHGCAINSGTYAGVYVIEWSNNYNDGLLSHEYIHWVRNKGNDLHQDEVFERCTEFGIIFVI